MCIAKIFIGYRWGSFFRAKKYPDGAALLPNVDKFSGFYRSVRKQSSEVEHRSAIKTAEICAEKCLRTYVKKKKEKGGNEMNKHRQTSNFKKMLAWLLMMVMMCTSVCMPALASEFSSGVSTEWQNTYENTENKAGGIYRQII